MAPRLAAALIVSMAACGSPPSKDEVTCGASWATTPPTDGTCDRACAEMMVGTGPSCTTSIVSSTGKIACTTTFDVEGDRGCCFDAGRVSAISGAGEPSRQRRVFFLSCQ